MNVFKVLMLLFVLIGCSSVVKRGLSSDSDDKADKFDEKCFFENRQIKEACLNLHYENVCENTDKIKCAKTFDEKIYPVSIVSDLELKLIVKKISEFKSEFYNDIQSGCHPRAFYIAGFFSKLAHPIQMGQVRITGEFEFKGEKWASHIAPYVYVKNGNELRRLVVDPATLPEKVSSLSDWLKAINSDSAKLNTRFLGPFLGFNYTIDGAGEMEIETLEKNKDFIVSHSFDELKSKDSEKLMEFLYLATLMIREEL